MKAEKTSLQDIDLAEQNYKAVFQNGESSAFSETSVTNVNMVCEDIFSDTGFELNETTRVLAEVDAIIFGNSQSKIHRRLNVRVEFKRGNLKAVETNWQQNSLLVN